MLALKKKTRHVCLPMFYRSTKKLRLPGLKVEIIDARKNWLDMDRASPPSTYQILPTLTSFLRLPTELQDAIWNNAVLPAPTVHFASLQREKKRIKARGVIRPWGPYSRHRYNLLIKRFLPLGLEESLPRLEIVSRVCRRSHAAVRQHEIQQVEPFRIDASEADNPALPAISIDAALDLVILHPNWANTARKTVKPPEFALPESRNPLRAQLRYLAVPWCAPWAKWSKTPAREAIEGLLAPFFGLHVLYVILEPEILNVARQHCSSGEDEICLEDYLATYRNHHDSPASFRYGDRVYHEIALADARKLGGLVGMMKVFNSVREKRASNPGNEMTLLSRRKRGERSDLFPRSG